MVEEVFNNGEGRLITVNLEKKNYLKMIFIKRGNDYGYIFLVKK